MLQKFLLVVALGMMVLTLIDCRKDDPVEPTPLDHLVATWKCTSAIRDGSLLDNYGDFELELSGTKGSTTYAYSCKGKPSPSPWLSSGTWKFGSDETLEIIRDPGTENELDIDYNVSGNILQVQFTFRGDGFSKTGEVPGSWKFTFSK